MNNNFFCEFTLQSRENFVSTSPVGEALKTNGVFVHFT